MRSFLSRINRRLSLARDRHLQPSWSQEGEDRLMDKLLDHRANGFFVDIGAHHPRKFSNTHLFHLNGWKGINVDANPTNIDLISAERPCDTNICALVSDVSTSLEFYEFNEPAVNTCDAKLAQERIEKGYFKLISKREITSSKLSEILKKHLPSNQTVDLLSIDVEGHELQVLISNDWEFSKPEWILVECANGSDDNPLNTNIREILDSDVCKYLESKSYSLFGRLCRTCVFKVNS